MAIFRKKNEVAQAAKNRDQAVKKNAKQQAKGHGVNATRAGRVFRDSVDEVDRNRRNGGNR